MAYDPRTCICWNLITKLTVKSKKKISAADPKIVGL